MLTVGSLFSGIGGFDLGLERAGMRVIWQSEIDPYACAVLRKHWPDVPNHGDIRGITGGNVERPDVLCGGFPCQDISVAGRGAGLAGEQSGLWHEYRRLVDELRPDFLIIENSPRLRALGLEEILGQLHALNFDATGDCIPAANVGAPHERDRVWIVANTQGHRCGSGWQGRFVDRLSGLLNAPRWNPADADRESTIGPAISWQECNAWPDEPALLGVDDGIPHRMDRVRCLGNAIVPQIAEIIGRAIVSAHKESP